MAIIVKREVPITNVYGTKIQEVNVYCRPTEIRIDANMNICEFWMEGRVNNIHGNEVFKNRYVIVIEKEVDLFKQIYEYVKTLDEYLNFEDV